MSCSAGRTVVRAAGIVEDYARMSIRVVRLGSPRVPGEGPRLGTVRRPPRGVRKTEYATGDFFDVWLPELSPSAELFSWARREPWTSGRWQQFTKRYRKEMEQPVTRHLIETLAALSTHANFSLGCYCEEEAHCHRSLLRKLLKDAKASITP